MCYNIPVHCYLDMYSPNEQKVKKMSKAQTITVENFVGNDVQITLEQFSKTWIDHVNQLRRISYSMDWQQEVSAMKMKVEKECKIEFDRLVAEK